MSDNAYYSEYLTTRKPSSTGEKMLRRWHEALFAEVSHELETSGKVRILEIGAGHGLFAEVVTRAGHLYEFVDISSSVHQFMINNGYSGFCGPVSEAPSSYGEYDIVWMSHVLEHAPDWPSARKLVDDAAERLRVGGNLVVISPDLLDSKFEFWNSDWSHGYPTSRRNVVQLFSDIGLELTASRYHRGARSNPIRRSWRAVLSRFPHSLIDLVATPSRHRRGEGYFYSWKTAFGWRQILVIGKRTN